MNYKKLLYTSMVVWAMVGSAHAATWTFITNGVDSSTQGVVTATATGWANTVGSTNSALESAYLTFNGNSGLGIKNKDFGSGDTNDNNEGSDPEHAIDNDQRKDSILFSFTGDKVNLSSTYFGWVSGASGYGDSDYSVYAYTGVSPMNLSGVTYTDVAMAAAGWALVGHYQGGSSMGTKTISSAIYSSYWLIGALNGTNDASRDAFKLKSVTGGTCADNPRGNGCGGTTTSVPEPGTILLVGMGLLGLTRITRRTAR